METEKKYKSEKLTDIEMDNLNSLITSFSSLVRCADDFGICPQALRNIKLSGKGSPSNVLKLREHFDRFENNFVKN